MAALPGGLARADGGIDRDFAWRPIDGGVEMALAEAARSGATPEAVSRALAGTLATLGGEPVTRDLVDTLSVPDRRYLMIELARALGLSYVWSTHVCQACGAPFDYALDLAALPVEPAGDGYPTATVMTERGLLRLRVPSGADQIRIAPSASDAAAARQLTSLCLVHEGDDGDEALSDLSDDDIAAVDAALEEIAPKIPWAINARCAECEAANVIPIATAGWLTRMADGPTGDVHEIAFAYGWSERDILALPREERLRYLALIRAGRDRLVG